MNSSPSTAASSMTYRVCTNKLNKLLLPSRSCAVSPHSGHPAKDFENLLVAVDEQFVEGNKAYIRGLKAGMRAAVKMLQAGMLVLDGGTVYAPSLTKITINKGRPTHRSIAVKSNQINCQVLSDA